MEPKRGQYARPWHDPQVITAQGVYGARHLKSRQQVAAHEQKLSRKGMLPAEHSMTCLECGSWKNQHIPHDEQGMLF
jgi:hypothetical protein